MTTQTPDAVREARRIAANVLGLPPGLRSEYMNGKYDTGDHVRIALAALDSRAGDAGEGKELFLVSLALSKPFAGGTTYSMSQSWRTGGTEQEAIDAAIMFAAKEKPGFGVWNMLIARVPLSATPAPAVDAVPAGEAERRAYLMTGRWELDPEGKAPGIYMDDPEGGDPICLCVVKRVYHPDLLSASLSHGEGRK